MAKQHLLTCMAVSTMLFVCTLATADDEKKSGLEKFGDSIGSKMEKVGDKIDNAAGKMADKMSDKKDAAPKMDEETMKQMEAMMPKPGPEHARLKKLAGTWDYTLSFMMGPGQPPQETKGTEENRMMGEFWILSDSKSEMMGMPFEGHGTYGYDIYKKKNVGTWVDSMTPEIMYMEGDYDEKAKTLTFTATSHDPMTKKEMKQRIVEECIDDDHRNMHFFGPGPDGKEVEMMTIKYTRRSK